MRLKGLAAALAALVLAVVPALAQDTLKLAIGQRGNWDTSVAEIGTRLGIFQRHGLTLEMLYTQGGGETQQAVISGSVDIGVAAGIMGALSAYARGAPVRIIGAQTTGANDLFWYVRSDSPIRRLEDAAGRTISYSTNGSSTHGVVTALLRERNLRATPTATGGPAATLTQVMSGQIDVGWSAPPFGLDLLEQGRIRIVATGNDATVFRGQTVRLLITNTQALQARRPVLERFMSAYRETVTAMYNDPAALSAYAAFVGIPEAIARRTRDEFFPPASLDPDRIVGVEEILGDAVRLRFIPAPLTQAQLTDLIQIPPRQ